ncbi:hypothetical protein [Morganella morganii]|uniref:hypothetical protein n=1 Tax=Morganella morganii TaxID=582 RepID=UPI00046AF82C|nr:hypothetical protein [Morganella morganii]
MKVRLLNDGDYGGMKNTEFPAVVDGFYYDGLDHVVGVSCSELIRVGADKDTFCIGGDLAFLIGEECEVINEQIS